jgi:hypothetical protein
LSRPRAGWLKASWAWARQKSRPARGRGTCASARRGRRGAGGAVVRRHAARERGRRESGGVVSLRVGERGGVVLSRVRLPCRRADGPVQPGIGKRDVVRGVILRYRLGRSSRGGVRADGHRFRQNRIVRHGGVRASLRRGARAARSGPGGRGFRPRFSRGVIQCGRSWRPRRNRDGDGIGGETWRNIAGRIGPRAVGRRGRRCSCGQTRGLIGRCAFGRVRERTRLLVQKIVKRGGGILRRGGDGGGGGRGSRQRGREEALGGASRVCFHVVS